MSSDFKFWAKHIGLGLGLIVVAILIIVLYNKNFNSSVPEGGEKKEKLGDNMSRVYAASRMSSTEPIEEKKGDFVLDVNMSEEDLQQRLRSMESLQSPVSGRWVGEHKFRTFKAGSTLRESISNYAQKEGMQVIWELDEDFIIKSQFQLENSVVGSLHKIARAIDSNFAGNVSAYFCPKQRTLIITDKKNNYLKTNCALAQP
ncbi:toxin co-regulated pilus biosynthesis Q family protein [Alteromonadaceae bacterium BrNp21-10]|nr:toxin co-regulated pilus biosynthesis Q family protein [Alteromonadaceae bacterium BrNp21-10]